MLRINRIAALVASSALLALSSSAQAVTSGDIAAASPFVFGDLTTFNWRILNQVNPAIPVPQTPTGNQLNFIRMYSNGNTHNPDPATTAVTFAPGNVSTYPDDASGFSAATRADFWYGLEFGKGQTPVTTKVLTGGDILDFIQSVSGPGANSPIFAFDQNQEGSDPDIYLRARLILVEDTINLLGLNSTQVTTAVNNAITNGDATVFRFYDDPALPNFGDPDQFVELPGLFDPDGAGMAFDPVDNNGAGNAADWGGYIASLDLNNFVNHAFILELEAKFNNNGKEEAYILGGLSDEPLPQPEFTPEPMTAGLSLMAIFAVGMAATRRRSAAL